MPDFKIQVKVVDGGFVDRLFFCIGSVSAFIGIAAGAFGAHGLREKIAPEMLDAFEVGVRYQMYHALALLATGWAASRYDGTVVATAGWLFVVGTVLFSGSLYALGLSGVRWLGAITPFGGAAYLGGWVLLAWGVWRAG